MAIQEYEPQPLIINPEEEKSPLDFFKDSLHYMVTDVEDSGYSALGHLIIIRNELKKKSVRLMKESYSADYPMDKLAEIQEEAVLTFHKLDWIKGYIQDRQPK